ncbi:MAG: hypothetical protein ABI304_00985 [Rudaea sp.]
MATSLLDVCGLAQAAAPSASGGAYNFTVNVTVASASILNIGPNDQIQFSDETSAYENSQSTLSFDSGSGHERASSARGHRGNHYR